jgi:hypothetical protein
MILNPVSTAVLRWALLASFAAVPALSFAKGRAWEPCSGKCDKYAGTVECQAVDVRYPSIAELRVPAERIAVQTTRALLGENPSVRLFQMTKASWEYDRDAIPVALFRQNRSDLRYPCETDGPRARNGVIAHWALVPGYYSSGSIDADNILGHLSNLRPGENPSRFRPDGSFSYAAAYQLPLVRFNADGSVSEQYYEAHPDFPKEPEIYTLLKDPTLYNTLFTLDVTIEGAAAGDRATIVARLGSSGTVVLQGELACSRPARPKVTWIEPPYAFRPKHLKGMTKIYDHYRDSGHKLGANGGGRCTGFNFWD